MANEPDQSEWKEFDGINSYALFMGYLSMAVKGMGFLVGLWTTVVLLGGFVSMLEKKDFWSLTIITLVQTAGVFDVFLNEKLRYAWKSFDGLLVTVAMVFRKEDDDDDSDQYWRALVGILVLLLQALVIAIILLPLALLYLFGLLVSTGLSMWRLIERDYGGEDGGANLTPALNVLYSLALFQGVLFCYQSASYFAGKRLARVVADDYGFDKEDEEGRESVRDYMRKTKIGCEKDPSFVKERNLVTFAVELMKSESSSADYVSGARILDKILAQEELQGQHALIRKLVGSASASQVLERLLQSLRSTSPLDRDVRVLAARIVAQLAGEISLASFPQGLRCISSLLDTTTTTTTTKQQDGDSAPSGHYKELMVLGRDILHKLAAADEHNCSAIGSNQGLVSKAMVPVTADLLHNIGHDAWSDIVAASLQLMFRLVALPGKAGDKLRSNKRAINTVEKILGCDECNEKLHVLAIKILTQLPMEAPSTSTADSKEKITKLLVDIFFTKENKDASTRQLAGEALAMLSVDQTETNAAIIFKASDTVVDDLKTTLLDVRTKSGYRISAAEILEHLYICYTKEDDCLKKLTEAMKDVLPKMLKEILPSPPLKQGEKHTEKGTDATKFVTQDPEIGEGAVATKDSGNVNEQKDDNKKIVDRKLHAALLSLSAAIFEKLIRNDTDLAQLANAIATGDSASSFAGKLKKLVEENSEPTANCLRILKIASRMIISLINLEGNYPKAELESLMESLSKASKEMFELEAFMMFSSSDQSAMNPVSILGSQVKQAQVLLENKKEQNVATTATSTTVGDP
uniref:Uncharacterized protein n=1 Tax=Oryza nivara TaxID=4536 RepID=A0A0E0I3S2_ORYNI